MVAQKRNSPVRATDQPSEGIKNTVDATPEKKEKRRSKNRGYSQKKKSSGSSWTKLEGTGKGTTQQDMAGVAWGIMGIVAVLIGLRVLVDFCWNPLLEPERKIII